MKATKQDLTFVTDCGHPLVGDAPECAMCGKRAVWTPTGINRAMLATIVDRYHVMEPVQSILDEVRNRIEGKARKDGTRPRTVPAAVLAGVTKEVRKRHKANLREYCEVMKHGPVPSEDLVRRAMMGEESVRKAILGDDAE